MLALKCSLINWSRWQVPPNKQLQRTVRDKVPRHIGQRAAAELRRYTQSDAMGSLRRFFRSCIAVESGTQFGLLANAESVSQTPRGPRVFCKGRARRISRCDIGVSLRWAPR